MTPEAARKIHRRLVRILGKKRAVSDPDILRKYSEDMTEVPASLPDIVVMPRTAQEIQRIVRLAAASRIPVTPIVAGTNLGGLAIPVKGGIVMDLRGMDRVLEVNREEMYALIEPGVTFAKLKEHLGSHAPDLTIGYPLSPPDVSILCNCLLDGLGNLSLRYGAMGDWINGIEAVLPSGEFIRTGSGALSPVWFSRAPLPDLTGLFLNWQGSTGIVTKLAVQLWPAPPHRKRSFFFFYRAEHGLSLLRRMARLRFADDLGGLTWPAAKMLLGVRRPGRRDPDEPEFFLYSDISGNEREEIRYKEKTLKNAILPYRKEIEGPLDVKDLVRFDSQLARFADFPMTLDFLLDEGGLTWVGSYGPCSRWEQGLRKGEKIFAEHGLPPLAVLRPMKGGHFGVLRFITVFNKKDPKEVARARRVNERLCDMVLDLGFIPYKAPSWAVKKFRRRLDRGYTGLLKAIKTTLDPLGIMNPGRWNQ